MRFGLYIFSYILLYSTTISIKNDYHPIKIYFDFTQLEQSNVEKPLINVLKNMLKQVGVVLSQFININNKDNLKSNLPPKNFCDSTIEYFDQNILKGINTDLLIYPIFKNI